MLTPLHTFDTFAALVGIKPQTARKIHAEGRGPRATYIGRLVRFTDEAVTAAYAGGLSGVAPCDPPHKFAATLS